MVSDPVQNETFLTKSLLVDAPNRDTTLLVRKLIRNLFPTLEP